MKGNFINIVKKKWGTEYWIVNNEDYCAKILEIKENWRTSYHYHKNKKETFFILKGKVFILLKDKHGFFLKKGEVLDIERLQVHSIMVDTGATDAQVLEISTHHDDEDSYRLDKSCKVEDKK